MRMPSGIDDITPGWLTEAFGESNPGLEVQDAAVRDVAHGACTKLRIGLRTNRNDFPSTVLMKAGFEGHSPHMRRMHVNEYHAYHDLVPTLGKFSTPHCFFAGQDERGHALVVLEDLCLRDVSFLSLQRPIGYELAARFLEGLARLHARWWNSPELDSRFAWAPDPTEEGMAHYFDLLTTPEEFGRYVAAPRGAAMPRMLIDAARIRRAHAAMREAMETQAQVVNHGDMHLGNLYLNADGSPGYLDWQPRRGAWSIDVSYFMIADLDVVDRRRWQGALLEHYLASLRALGVAAPGFDEAWTAYRQGVVWGLLIWFLNSSRFQTESNNTAAAARFGAAMVDLDTFNLLGV
ncbi:MAG: phosphotransferase [Caulobacteraceae bacterium]|nr:phosphotransferase [Caulobacteraceae bacterium]